MNHFLKRIAALSFCRSLTTTTMQSSPQSISNAKFSSPKIVSKATMDYAMKYGFHETPAATALRLETAGHERSRMMGDPIEAALFSLLLGALNARKVVEVGVFTGYTTLVMAQSLPEDGKIVALDISKEFCSIGEKYWKQAGVESKIDLRIAPAAETLQGLLDEGGQEDTFDFAFIDADKTNYRNYYELLLRLIRPGGIIAIDNVFWGGKVYDESITDADEDTTALRDITKHVFQDDRVEHVMLPFADGVTLVRRK